MSKYIVRVWKVYVYEDVEAETPEQAEDQVIKADGWGYDDVAKVEVEEADEE